MGKTISQIPNEESTAISDTDWLEGEENGGTGFRARFSVYKNTLKTHFDALYHGIITTVASTVTTSNVNLAENTINNLTITGLTANRNLIMPAPSAAGKKITVNILDGNDTYFMILIGDTGVTINGGSAATEFHRLRTKAKSLTFRSTSTTNWQCVAGLEVALLELRNYDALEPFAGSGSAKVVSYFPSYPFQLINVLVSYTVLTTNNGSNYWTFTLSNLSGNLGSVNTSAASADTTYRVNLTSSKTNFLPSDVYALITGTHGAGTPGSTYIFCTLTVWLS